MTFLAEYLTLSTPMLLAILIGVLAIVYSLIGQRKSRLPPQPGLSLPVIGHLYKLPADPRQRLAQWRKELGDVYSFQLGPTLIVMLNGYDTIKEAFVKRGAQFSNRVPQYYDIGTGILDRGVVSSSGPDWKENRAFVLNAFKQYGMGSTGMAQRISEEGKWLVRCLTQLSERGLYVNISSQIRAAVSNVTCNILIGSRMEYNDPDFQNLVTMLNATVDFIGGTNILNVFPSLRHLPGDPFSGNVVESNIKNILKLLFIKYNDLDDGIKENSMIAAYNEEMEKKKQSGIDTFMDNDSLKRICFDLFWAGTETTASTIDWCILFMLHYPDMQKKIFEEVDSVIGTERLPTVEDRGKMAYLNAFIMESIRLSDIAPMSVPHATSEDVEFRGFLLPKATSVMPNLSSVMQDPEIWGQDVKSFRPERFLDSERRLVRRDEYIPFSIGRRICPGEGLAEMELTFFLAMMIQSFEFLPEDPDNLPTTKSQFGVTVRSLPYKLRLVQR